MVIDLFVEVTSPNGQSVQLDEHPILDLLRRPNPTQGYSAFMESAVAFGQIAGNSYLNAVRPNPRMEPTELWTIQPDLMRVVPGPTGLPASYVFSSGSQQVDYPVDPVTGDSDILQMKAFNPQSIWYGMSPIEPSMIPIDQHNEAGKWNINLLMNEASRRLIYIIEQSDSNPAGSLSEEAFQNFRSQLINKFSGSQNAGKVQLLEGGIGVKEVSMSPKDMDWLEGRREASRDIARSFGVPPIRS